MTTRRKKPVEADETERKRRCVEEDDLSSVSSDTACFDALNDDCLVHILSFLPAEDMDSVAICNQHCREARHNESLDHSRTATIVCSEAKSTTVRSFFAALNAASNTLTSNYTRLKIVSMEKLENSRLGRRRIVTLPNIYCLELSLNPNERTGSTRIHERSLSYLSYALPNLSQLTMMNGVSFDRNGSYLLQVYRSLPKLVRVTWNGGLIHPEGSDFGSRVTELLLNGCRCIYPIHAPGLSRLDALNILRVTSLRFSSEPMSGYFVLMHCNNLERLSIKGATWSIFCRDQIVSEPISQEMLMKMVRHLSNLVWLQSDLTEENVDILKRERPEITFVTE